MAKLRRIPKDAGFTLIEMMTVVVIIGILIAIAIPNYQEYLLRSKLVDASSSLAQLRVRLEQYYQDNRSYDAKPDAPDGACGGAPVSGQDSRYFAYTCATTDDGQKFTITATGRAEGGTSAFTYTIDEGNSRKTTAVPTGWNTGACWITSKGQQCG